MWYRCLKALMIALALAAWVVLFLATPVHLYVAHSYHNDCPACRAQMETAHQCTRTSCCCHVGKSYQPELALDKKPPEHNHEHHRFGEYCSTCQILLGQNKILVATAPMVFDWQVVAECVLETQLRVQLRFFGTRYSRAPPA